ncbi:MAG: hypothetical protein HYV63_24750 [Candidatus Schekmanbacteria bacterium]|nr:hypothetical protein [Candidatus Schekmanbacteria bacterium]
MRTSVNPEKVYELMRALARAARGRARVYFTGGATAVLKGWRSLTIDVDLRFEPERPELFAALPALKEKLCINVEMASPQDFIPPLPGWTDRSELISTEGPLTFYHYDFYAQTLAKIERGHAQDAIDIASFFQTGLVDPERLLAIFRKIEDDMPRYPAIDVPTFRAKVETAVAFGRDPSRGDPIIDSEQQHG